MLGEQLLEFRDENESDVSLQEAPETLLTQSERDSVQFIYIHDEGKMTVHLIRVNKHQCLSLTFPNILKNLLVIFLFTIVYSCGLNY